MLGWSSDCASYLCADYTNVKIQRTPKFMELYTCMGYQDYRRTAYIPEHCIAYLAAWKCVLASTDTIFSRNMQTILGNKQRRNTVTFP